METIEIKLLDLYHEKILFTQLRTGKGGEIKLTINNKFEFAKSNDLKNLKTTIITTIKDDDMRINMEFRTVGIFQLDNIDEYENPKYSQIMVNTMWPFVRNEVQLITTQPGLTPIILPLIAPFKPKEEKTIYA